jgi:hypothetical protein
MALARLDPKTPAPSVTMVPGEPWRSMAAWSTERYAFVSWESVTALASMARE